MLEPTTASGASPGRRRYCPSRLRSLWHLARPVQVKRWKDTVGRPEVQKLEGVRSGNRAAYGIFITTGSFSTGATEEAKRSNIELIDGDRLAEICLKHEIGVENRQLAIPRIDEDFFERL